MRAYLRSLPPGDVRRSLRFSIWDAILWSVMFGLAENFIVPFTLLFGATVLEIGLLQGAAQLSAGVSQLVGATIAEHGVSKRRLITRAVKIHAVSWLVILAVALVTRQSWLIIVAYCLSVFAGNFGGPSWMSWMNDLVPVHQRGRYWSSRNRTSGFAQMSAIAAAGVFLWWSDKGHWVEGAYVVLFGLAFVARLAGSFCVAAQHEPERPSTGPSGDRESWGDFLRGLRSTNLARFITFSVLMNFSIVFIYPVIQVYLLEELRLNYLQYSAVVMTFTIASFVFMTYWGPLADQFGNRRILLAAAILLPLVALAWVFVRDWRGLLLVQLVSGFLVAGVNLSTTNFLFDAVPPSRLTRTVATFTAVNTFLGFLGTVAGGGLAAFLRSANWHVGGFGPLAAVFLLGAVFRAVVLGFWGRRFADVRSIEQSPGLGYFYWTKPYHDARGLVSSLHRRWRRDGRPPKGGKESP